MTKIKGTDGLSEQQINQMLMNGARFVMYQYCVSLLVVTLRRSSDIYFVHPGENAVTKGMSYTVLTLVMGWWGIPWGPIYTIGALYKNLRGGIDVTHEVTMAVSGI